MSANSRLKERHWGSVEELEPGEVSSDVRKLKPKQKRALVQMLADTDGEWRWQFCACGSCPNVILSRGCYCEECRELNTWVLSAQGRFTEREPDGDQ